MFSKKVLVCKRRKKVQTLGIHMKVNVVSHSHGNRPLTAPPATTGHLRWRDGGNTLYLLMEKPAIMLEQAPEATDVVSNKVFIILVSAQPQTLYLVSSA